MMMQSFVVLVLGDLGRSPRMQYHALSLANMSNTKHVSLVGLEGETCIQELEHHPKIDKVTIGVNYFQHMPRKFFLLYAPFKVLFQIIQLFWILLFVTPKTDAILIQNPPCIPTFMVAQVVSMIRGSKIVIDWHNLGYTILEMNLGSSNTNAWLVAVARNYERFFAQFADFHLCVTETMKLWLVEHFKLRASLINVVHDKPPANQFKPLTIKEKHDLFMKLNDKFVQCLNKDSITTDTKLNETKVRATENGQSVEITPFTIKHTGKQPERRPDAPCLVVSSTSWTADEDFSILLDAIVQVDSKLATGKHVFVVTGKGPLKCYYEEKMNQLKLKHCVILTLWLEREDYPLLLGASDFGICLHTSSSSLDLPMKIIDMFGAGLPVCAVGYDCLEKEMVEHGKNGLIFHSSEQLATQLLDLLSTPSSLNKLSEYVKVNETTKWEENWNNCAKPVFDHCTRSSGILPYLIVLLLAFGSYYYMQ